MISTLLLTHFAICLSQAWEIKAPMVQVEQGALEGTYLTSRNGRQYMAFQGIPYAQPPVGNLRFKDPEPPKIWKGIWNAKEPGSACLQFQRIHTPSQQSCKPIVGDEDCLYLNIYTPKLPTKAENSLLDVFVYIHGGAFMYGWGHEYSTNIILDRDVVFVTINYRVGPLELVKQMTVMKEVIDKLNAMEEDVMRKRIAAKVQNVLHKNSGNHKLCNIAIVIADKNSALKYPDGDRKCVTHFRYDLWFPHMWNTAFLPISKYSQ